MNLRIIFTPKEIWEYCWIRETKLEKTNIFIQYKNILVKNKNYLPFNLVCTYFLLLYEWNLSVIVFLTCLYIRKCFVYNLMVTFIKTIELFSV